MCLQFACIHYGRAQQAAQQLDGGLGARGSRNENPSRRARSYIEENGQAQRRGRNRAKCDRFGQQGLTDSRRTVAAERQDAFPLPWISTRVGPSLGTMSETALCHSVGEYKCTLSSFKKQCSEHAQVNPCTGFSSPLSPHRYRIPDLGP